MLQREWTLLRGAGQWVWSEVHRQWKHLYHSLRHTHKPQHTLVSIKLSIDTSCAPDATLLEYDPASLLMLRKLQSHIIVDQALLTLRKLEHYIVNQA